MRPGDAAALLLAAAVLLGAAPARADSALADLVEKVAPSVVNLHTSGVRQTRSYWDSFFGGPRRWESLGSGFVVDAERGLIITNQHVIGSASEILVMDHSGRVMEAKALGADEGIDLAVLQVTDIGLPAVTLGDSRTLRVGEDVFAVGNPYGHGHSVTRGILSARARSLGRDEFDLFLQTDAAINPGSSGGPLFDASGRVIGVNTAIDSRGESIGFAMPVELVRAALELLVRGKDVVPGWPGLRLEEQRGGELRIAAVYPGGPAQKAGVQVGDQVVTVDELPCRGRSGWSEAFGGAFPGDTRVLGLQRGRVEQKAVLKLQSRKDWAKARVGRPLDVEALRVRVQAVAPDVADGLLIDSGVEVVAVGRGSFFRRGDIVIELNGKSVATPADLALAADLALRQRWLSAIVHRDGSKARIVQRW